jgi:hypothetical protein
VSTHLRVSTRKLVSLTRYAQPGGRRPASVWYGEAIFSRGKRRQSTRCARVACDGGFSRWDESVQYRKGIPTCGHCAVIFDYLLEIGFDKPLTARRLGVVKRAMKGGLR